MFSIECVPFRMCSLLTVPSMEYVLYSSIECVLDRNTQTHTDTYRHMHDAAAGGGGGGSGGREWFRSARAAPLLLVWVLGVRV